MTTAVSQRIVNFNAGPAALPAEVLEEACENLIAYGDTGVGIMEHSHRSPAFSEVIQTAEADCRQLLGLTDDYAVLFLSGGASSQFFMVPMNLLNGATADYIDTGSWSSKAIKEAKKFGTVNIAASSKDTNYTYIPKTQSFTKDAVYTHFTSNNTIFGTQWRKEPDAPTPLVCDASSDILSHPVQLDKYGLIYAGAQKNLGPAGVTLVIVRKDLAERASADLPTMLQYRTHIEGASLYNTPPSFAVYMVGLVLKWLKKKGGVPAMEKINQEKAAELYGVLDSSDFWRPPVEKEDRSLMNVVFRLPSEDLEAKLIKEALAAGYNGIKGHRSVGGIRVSIYNAITREDVHGFCEFLKEFEKKNG